MSKSVQLIMQNIPVLCMFQLILGLLLKLKHNRLPEGQKRRSVVALGARFR